MDINSYLDEIVKKWINESKITEFWYTTDEIPDDDFEMDGPDDYLHFHLKNTENERLIVYMPTGNKYNPTIILGKDETCIKYEGDVFIYDILLEMYKAFYNL